MLPAQEGLDGGHPPRGQVEDRLVVQAQLSLGQGLAQPALQGQALQGGGVHVGSVELVAVAALLLGAVHRGVGVLHQRLRVPAVLRVEADADAGRHEQLLVLLQEGLAQRVEHLVRHLGRVHRRGDVGQQQRELVAAQPRHRVAFPQAAAQPLRHVGDQAVAHGVAQGIVDDLEAVEVQEQHGQALAVTVGLGHGQGQAVGEEQPVGQLGERVVVGQAANLLLGLLALGDVERGPDGPPRLAGLVEERRRVAQDGGDLAALAHHVHLDVHDLLAGGGRPLHGQLLGRQPASLPREVEVPLDLAGRGAERGVGAGGEAEQAAQVAVAQDLPALGVARHRDPDGDHVQQGLELRDLPAQALLAVLERLEQPRVLDGDGGMGGQRLRQAHVLGGEEAGLGAVQREQPDGPAGRAQGDADPAADVLRARVPLPAGLVGGVGDEPALGPVHERAQDGMVAHLVDGLADRVGASPLLVAAHRAHGQPLLVVQQHDVGGVVGDELLEAAQERLQDGRQVERPRQIQGRRTQDLGDGHYSGMRMPAAPRMASIKTRAPE